MPPPWLIFVLLQLHLAVAYDNLYYLVCISFQVVVCSRTDDLAVLLGVCLLGKGVLLLHVVFYLLLLLSAEMAELPPSVLGDAVLRHEVLGHEVLAAVVEAVAEVPQFEEEDLRNEAQFGVDNELAANGIVCGDEGLDHRGF